MQLHEKKQPVHGITDLNENVRNKEKYSYTRTLQSWPMARWSTFARFKACWIRNDDHPYIWQH